MTLTQGMGTKIYIGEDGRKYIHTGHAPKLYWSQDSIDLLKRYFPRTGSGEIAEMLGFSPMSVKRKAKELGLKKDLEHRRQHNIKRLKLANLHTRLFGNKGAFPKGYHNSPATEWKPKYTLKLVETGFVGCAREIAKIIGAQSNNVVAAAKRNGTCKGYKIEFYDTERI